VFKFSVTGVLAFGLVAHIAAAQSASAADPPKPADGDKSPPPGFNATAIVPLRDGANYWPDII